MNDSFNLVVPPPYPITAFHSMVADAVQEVIEKVKAPDALVGMSFLATMSTACQGLIDVKLPTGEVKPISLNIMVKAESGERKTTVDNIVAAPIVKHDEDSLRRHNEHQAEFDLTMKLWKVGEKILLSRFKRKLESGEDTQAVRAAIVQAEKEKPREPHSSRIIYQTATDAALMKQLAGDGVSVAITGDEGEVILRGGLMSKPGLRNKTWDGPRFLISDTISNGSVIAMNPRVTINLMVQDGVMQDYLAKYGARIRGSGHWARYLVGAPASTQGFRFINHLDETWHRLPAFHTRVMELLAQYDAMMKSGDIKRQVIEFDPAATAEWIRMVNVTESMIQPWQYLSDIHDFASKAMEIVSRVAALLHFFTGQKGHITLDTLNRAIDIVRWHLHEFKRLFSPQGVTSTMQENIIEVEKFLFFNYWKVGLFVAVKNQLLRNGPNRLRSKTMLDPVVSALEAQGRIRLFKDVSSNKNMIELNPQYFNSLMYY